MKTSRRVTTTKIVHGLHTSRSSTRKRKCLKRFNMTEIIVDKNVKLLVELQGLAH